MTRVSHRDARALCNEAFRRVFGREPKRSEAQLAQAIGRLESNYGQGWKPPGDGSHNIGAIQKGTWTGKTFTYTDTRPNADGTSTPYVIEFRKYNTAIDGWVDLIKRVYTGGIWPKGMAHKAVGGPRMLLVLPAATRGDAAAFSAGLYDTVYYQGHGKTREARIANHRKAVLSALLAMAKEIKEPLDALGDTLTGEEIDALEASIGVRTVNGEHDAEGLAALMAAEHTASRFTDGDFSVA